MVTLAFALPWIAATLWIAYRAGWHLLWSNQGREHPSQATQLRSFGGS
jgi:hypothetical protein